MTSTVSSICCAWSWKLSFHSQQGTQSIEEHGEERNEEGQHIRTLLLHGPAKHRHRPWHDVVAVQWHALLVEPLVQGRVASYEAVRCAAEVLRPQRLVQVPGPLPRPLPYNHRAAPPAVPPRRLLLPERAAPVIQSIASVGRRDSGGAARCSSRSTRPPGQNRRIRLFKTY
jgi:hypothetical protein